MINKVPLRFFAYAMVPLSLAGFAVVVCRPPFWVAMIVDGLEIIVFAVALARAIGEALRPKDETA